MVVIFAFIYWGIVINKEDEDIKDATHHATVALIIAYFAHGDMFYLVFFVIWLFRYYSGRKWA